MNPSKNIHLDHHKRERLSEYESMLIEIRKKDFFSKIALFFIFIFLIIALVSTIINIEVAAFFIVLAVLLLAYFIYCKIAIFYFKYILII